MAEFTDVSGNDATQYTATINWGDGQTSSGTIVNIAPNDYVVTAVGITGGNIYQNEGSTSLSLPITVQITDGNGYVATMTASATVAPLTAGNLQSAIQTASNSTIVLTSLSYGDLQAAANALGGVDPSLTGTIQLTLPGNDYSPAGGIRCDPVSAVRRHAYDYRQCEYVEQQRVDHH